MRKINFIIILLLSSICCFGQGVSASSINRRATLFLNKRVGIKDYKIGKPDYTCIKMKDSISSFFLGKVDTVSIDQGDHRFKGIYFRRHNPVFCQ
ncbi:hypothetical protein [Phocaeicola vulgatus]|uniref:hypothetical protein n=1 Tax=Phocaeicola vulgatus TaxID=821 RepID=UPI0035624CAD